MMVKSIKKMGTHPRRKWKKRWNSMISKRLVIQHVYRKVSRYEPSTLSSAEDSRCRYLHEYVPWSSGFKSRIRSFWTLCFTSDEYLPFISNCRPFLNHWAWTLGTDNWQDSVHGWPSLPEVSCRCLSTSTSETQTRREDRVFTSLGRFEWTVLFWWI